ncbi:hemerythrin domain-containing protein [Hirschia litorea]|uniref:Hemerythrin domain-containing protein n=1 Tax=Hirschia litorea TaxID=1199156 RepID=A0ABW2ILN9_9PROT
MTDIYEVLEADHNHHRELLEQLSQTSGDTSQRRQLWEKFYFDVKSHAAAEEETFYANLMKTEDGQSKARHSVAEHKEVDDVLDELNEMDMSSSGWLNRFNSMRHDYEHHIDEEEEDIFPVGKQEISVQLARELAQKFKERKRKERDLVDEKTEEKLVE